MQRHNAGFVLLEAGTSIFMALVILLALAAAYKGILSLMLMHNAQKDGLELAQLEMARLANAYQVDGEANWGTEKYVINTKVMYCAKLNRVKRLEVTIYKNKKNVPLVNLVRYE